MKLTIDTKNPIPHIEMTEEEENSVLSKNLAEFCFGIASLAVDYIGQTVKPKDYENLKKALVHITSDMLDKMLEEGVLDDDELEEEMENLREQLEANGGFSNEEIEAVLNIVRETGSMEAATKFLMSVGEEAGIDMEKELEKLEN